MPLSWLSSIPHCRKLKKLETAIGHPRTTDESQCRLTVFAISDPSRAEAHDQSGITPRLLVGELKRHSIFYVTLWVSLNSTRPVKSDLAAAIFAATKATDKSKEIGHAFSKIFNMKIKVLLCVDTKDLFTTFSTHRNSIDRSIRSDLHALGLRFKLGVLKESAGYQTNSTMQM